MFQIVNEKREISFRKAEKGGLLALGPSFCRREAKGGLFTAAKERLLGSFTKSGAAENAERRPGQGEYEER